MKQKALKIAVIAGEESGDLLAADAIAALRRQYAGDISLIGVGGAHLGAEGLVSLFNQQDIALMGVAEVLKKLPRLIGHIYRLTRYLAQEKPDFLLIIDCPDFTHRVARRLRKLAPAVPIIQYVVPSVWAWRPQRAKNMRGYIDLLLAILPFEPQILAELDGPKTIYVGHRLLSYPPLQNAYAENQRRQQAAADSAEAGGGAAGVAEKSAPKQTLLILPGSRLSEIQRLMPVFGQAAAEIGRKNPALEVILPTLPHLTEKIAALAAGWPIKPHITTTEAEKWAAFAKADAALAASGTVSLELALCAVPTILAYKADWFATQFILPKITSWSAALPNLITDEAIVPEYFNQFVRAPMLAHQLDRLLQTGAARQAQLDGFAKLRAIMHTDEPAGELAAQAIIEAGFCR